jgi:serine/threonine protein kinase
MILKCPQFSSFEDSLLKTRRFVFEGKESKEKAPKESSVPDEEKIDNRKTEARKEVDAIYELGDYNTYNFRTLPQDFKDRMKKNFGQWIDGNISKYDKDSNSGIDAAEYKTFKTELTKKVREILDRLADLKKEKKAEAEKTKENAEAAAEAQKRLKGLDVTKIDTANMETADGVYTELLKYQKDFENEAEDFGKLGVTFGDAKQKVEDANKSHTTGATALGEYLVNLAPWAEDIPEVKEAKKAKEAAVKDFQTKLAEMKKKQKDRQKRGEDLNGAPEKVKEKTKKKYKDARDKTTEHLDLAKAKKAENDKKKKDAEDRIAQNEKTQKDVQHQYDVMVSKMRMVAERKKEMEEKTADVEKAQQGLEAAKGEVEKRKQEGNGVPADVVQQIEQGQKKAGDAATQLHAGSEGVTVEEIKMDTTLSGLQGQLSKLIADTGRTKKAQVQINAADTSISDTITKLDANLKTINDGEKAEIEMIDSLDESISGTVLEVDTANFELIKKAENYLKTLKHLDVKGPGLIDTAGAMVMGIPGVEAGTGWVSKKVGAGWEWAKKAPVLGAAIEIVGYMGEGWTKSWDAIGSGLNWIGDKMHLHEAWDWMSDASKHLSIGNPTGNNLVDTLLDTFSGGGLGTIIEVFAGVTEGCKGLIEGIGMIVRNPIDAVKGLGQLVNHPGMIIDALLQKDKWGDESASKIIGRMMVDVVTTLTGAGATATAVKTAAAAVKIGSMGVGRAALLGARTFVEVFVKDISGLVVGVVKLPATLAKGVGNLAITIAKGGKKLEVAEGAALATTKKVATAEEGYKALEAVRGKPDEFTKLVREHPEYIDLHAKHAREIGKKAKLDAGKKGKAEKPETKDKKTEAPSKKKETEAAKEKPQKKTSEEEPAKPKKEEATEIPEDRTAPAGNAGKKRSEEKLVRETEERALLEAQQKKLEDLKVTPDFSPKPKTPERTNMVATLEGKVKDHPGLKAAAQTVGGSEFYRLVEALPTEELRLLENSLESLDATLIQRILKQEYQFTVNSKGEKVRVYIGETLGQGGFGIVSDCAYVAGKGEGLTIGALKRPKDTTALKAEAQGLADMLKTGELSVAELASIEKDAVALRKKFHTETMPKEDRMKLGKELTELEGLLRDKKLTDAYKSKIHERLAQLNFQVNSIMRNFGNEIVAMRIVEAEMGQVPGLIRPRVVSAFGEPMIITDKIVGKHGDDVVLKKRMFDDVDVPTNPADIFQYLRESLDGLDALHERGFVHLDFKPENVFVGTVGKGAEHGYLGDLALLSVEQLAELRIVPAGVEKIGEKSTPRFAVLQPSANGRLSDSRQIGITPGYFSPEHLTALIEHAKKAVAEARAQGLDPSKVKLPKEILSMADNHQVGQSISRYCNFMDGMKDGAVASGRRADLAKKWGVSEKVLEEVAADLRYYAEELKKTDGKVTVPEVMVALETARAKLIRAGAKPSELPTITTL